jgi:hypothetical protein
MDAKFFLRDRTGFIRFFYDTSAAAFRTVQERISAGKEPFDCPPHNDAPEPPYLEEWMEAETGIDVLGQSCVSLLSDTLKLYFETLQKRVIRYSLSKGLMAHQSREGFVAANRIALGQILQTDWSDCPVKFDVIEQVVLARNRAQHGDHLSSFRMQHDGKTLRKHSKPFFANEDELALWEDAGGDPEAYFTAPGLTISRDNLFAAIAETEALADWIDERLDRARKWRSDDGF